jgi:formylglycine-generating enzyme required for sulfatase activity
MIHQIKAHRLTTALLLSGLHTGVYAEELRAFRDCTECPEMIELPLGSFTMGAPPDEFRRNLVWHDGAHRPATPEHPFVKDDEGPQFHVTVDIPIAMSRNEVTYDQWMACVSDGGCDGYVPRPYVWRDRDTKYDPTGSHPVLLVSYEDALNYATWLNEKVGSDVYRLPTEAEWEYAARAGTQTRFAQGDDLTANQANFARDLTEMVLLEERPDLVTRRHPVPVEELDAANPWGLRHMSGNALEMTMSCYIGTYPGWGTTSEWLAESAGDDCRRTVRGGDYDSPIDILRVAWRASIDVSSGTKHLGFRVVRELDEEF